jgi:hypothetical protein
MYAVEDTLAFTAGTSLWARYLQSFWFMLSILLGSERGDISPTTSLEVVVTVVFEMLGCVIFGVIIGLFGSLLMGQKLLEAKVEQQVNLGKSCSLAPGFPLLSPRHCIVVRPHVVLQRGYAHSITRCRAAGRAARVPGAEADLEGSGGFGAEVHVGALPEEDGLQREGGHPALGRTCRATQTPRSTAVYLMWRITGGIY